MFAIGNDELGKKPPLNPTHPCPVCKQVLPVVAVRGNPSPYTTEDCPPVSVVKCPADGMFMVGMYGRDVA